MTVIEIRLHASGPKLASPRIEQPIHLIERNDAFHPL